jgi:hypothetical protein
MSRRDEDRAFLEEAEKIRMIAEKARETAEGRVRERVDSGLSMPAISAAIDEGLARRDALSRREGASIRENVAFVTLATAVAALRMAAYSRLQPALVLGLEAGLIWLSPFIFYVIFRLDRRAAQRGEGEAR